MSERLTVMLAPGAAEKLIALAGGPRKQGQYLSTVIDALYSEDLAVRAGGEVETLHLALAGLAAKTKELEGRLLALERQR